MRLTGLCGANALGEKLPLFVIGKSAKPQSFKNVKNLPCRIRSQCKSWMTGELFQEWLFDPDRRMARDGRNTCMIVDNYPAHPNVDGLKATELRKFPTQHQKRNLWIKVLSDQRKQNTGHH